MKERFIEWLADNGLSAETFGKLPFGDQVSVMGAWLTEEYGM